MSDSTVLRIPEYQLQRLRINDNISFRYHRGNFTTSSNNYTTAETITVQETGWYFVTFSASSGSGTGIKARLYNNTTLVQLMILAGDSNEYSGGQRMDLIYLNSGEELLVQYGRNSSVGGFAEIGCLRVSGVLISDDAGP